MDLPLIVDLALGLLLTYLTLSVLASEIQEIIGTVLQWRAEHLRRSIEQLLDGDSLEHTEAAQALADQLYDSPLIRSLNYEANKGLTSLPRRILHGIGKLYRGVFRVRNPFGKKTSGPSYIPSKTFATALIESLNLGQFQQILTQVRLRTLFEEQMWLPINRIVNDLRASTADDYLLAPELKQFELAIAELYQNFKAERVTLRQTVEISLTKLDSFIEQAKTTLPAADHLSETALTRLVYLRKGLAISEPELNAMLQKVQPSMAELLTILNRGSDIYQEAKAIADGDGGPIQTLLTQLETQPLPQNLKESLVSIAAKTQRQMQKVEDTLTGFELSVEQWFDSAMERAGGVYKRNSKAVAILIGIAMAYTVNADTFHIASRLTTDQALRDSITQITSQISSSAVSTDNPDQLGQELDIVTTAIGEELEGLPLPVGRAPGNLTQQLAAEQNWTFPVPRRVFGWIVTGIAISMGANFWYGLLKRVISVRTTGEKKT
ncbi:MAG: hypothetical protein AAF728_04195 [Cyanobacteria bacterium P01_D01_bin.128]